MFDFLRPHYYFHSIHEVSVDFYKKENVKGVLFDIDNTLEPYATAVPSPQTVELIDNLRSNNIKVAIISNNHEPRVSAFCQPLNVNYSYDSGKPSSKKIDIAIEQMGLAKNDVVLVGDQLFTDIWAASNSKIKGIFVDKINSDESFFIKLKRVLEIPFVLAIKKKGYGKIK